jgi:hypothetical protein
MRSTLAQLTQSLPRTERAVFPLKLLGWLGILPEPFTRTLWELSQKPVSHRDSREYQNRLNLYLARPSVVLFENLGHTLGYGLNIGVAQRFDFFAHPRR